VQNSEQEISGNWSKIKDAQSNKDQKRLINDEEYHQRLESRVSDLITKIKTGEQTLEQLSEEDQKLVKDSIDNDT
jgi:predicted metal-dependent hydrolase